MFKTESTLGLAGSILATVFSALLTLGALLLTMFIDLFRDFLKGTWHFTILGHSFDSTNLTGFINGILWIVVAVFLALSIASVILGFAGAGKLKRDDKHGGVLLIIAGVFAFLSVIGFVPFILFLIGGIMSASKKIPAKI